ncbi:MAG: hypothetical protein KatS3mg031_2339 [Chitinophagales bacterium]|nr:MAG: hypothetical protein KatS3mg031_2339 [Chitinophagales bacterium]
MKKTGHSRNKDSSLNKLSLPVADGYQLIRIKDIIRCEADGGYSHVFLKDKRLMVAKPLKLLEARLRPFHFVRVHQHHLVNLHYVLKYIKGKGGQLALIDGSSVNVSVRLKKNLISALHKMGV